MEPREPVDPPEEDLEPTTGMPVSEEIDDDEIEEEEDDDEDDDDLAHAEKGSAIEKEGAVVRGSRDREVMRGVFSAFSLDPEAESPVRPVAGPPEAAEPGGLRMCGAGRDQKSPEPGAADRGCKQKMNTCATPPDGAASSGFGPSGSQP